MSDKEIKQIDLGKYKEDGKKGLILEVDCKKIAEKYNISIGLVSKLIPTLRDKKEYVLHYRNL